jgi:hypothetical protein
LRSAAAFLGLANHHDRRPYERQGASADLRSGAVR